MSDEFQTSKPAWFLERVLKGKLLLQCFNENSERMTYWEKAFCEGIEIRFDETPEPHFSDAQELKMDEILNKY